MNKEETLQQLAQYAINEQWQLFTFLFLQSKQQKLKISIKEIKTKIEQLLYVQKELHKVGVNPNVK